MAVNIAEDVIKSAWSKWNSPLVAVPTPIENNETINAATVAWTWTNAIFPTTIWDISFADDILPRFACVESRDASVMSKFPFKPNNAGTRMKSCGICLNTSQCCNNDDNNKLMLFKCIPLTWNRWIIIIIYSSWKNFKSTKRVLFKTGKDVPNKQTDRLAHSHTMLNFC